MAATRLPVRLARGCDDAVIVVLQKDQRLL
jgi:hypothetical protein